MYYKKFKPTSATRKHVECYYIWEGITIPSKDFETPPSAFGSIVFNYKNPYQVSDYRSIRKQVPKVFMMGQATKSYTLHIQGEIGMIGMVLKPTALYDFFGKPMYAFTDERIALKQFPLNNFCKFNEQIQESFNHETKLEILQSLTEHLISQGGYCTPAIQYASNEILQSKGQTDIPTLIKSSNMSRRKFERKFLEEVGVSPKVYTKIRRFSYACSLIQGKRKAKLTDILFNAGYYDQSHFIKDFKYFTGRAPKFYMQTNTELPNYLNS